MIECKWSFDDADTVFDPDAGNYAELAGVFAATHRPVPGERTVAGAAEEFVEDAAKNAFEALMTKSTKSWPIIIPVLGEPGTGKSHLVRWVWNQFHRRPDDSFAVVYIPRIRMNMAGVMERLLEAALKDPNEDVREAAQDLVDTAKATYQDRDTGRVARELLAEVILQLKRSAARRVEVGALPTGSSRTQLNNLVDALETILDEGSAFARYLHSSESAIGRRVSALVDGRPEGALHEVPPGFTEEELRQYSPRAAGQSQEFTQAVRRAIVNQEWASLELTAQLLNDALDRAVSVLLTKGTQGRGVTFTEVFRRLRESLYTANRELVVFVEELKLLGGVERELLESFLDNTEAVGLERICRVRAIIACTTGEWTSLAQDIGTLTSRLNAWRAPQYTLDGGATLSLQNIEGRLIDMAAHYLNAARTGIAALEADFRNTDDEAAWAPPNACDSCEVRDRCHSTFGVGGADGNDFGLFPFNLRALTRAQQNVQRQQIRTPLDDGFNPRILLTGVLAPVVKHLTDDREQFPNIALARELSFPPASEATIAQALEVQGWEHDAATQGAILLEGWGEAKAVEGQQLTELTVHANLAEMLGASAPPPVSVPPITALPFPVHDDGDDRIPPVEPGLTAAIERWRNGTDLVTPDRRELRNRLYDLAMRYLDWNDFTGVAPRKDSPLAREAGLTDAEQFAFFEETTPTQESPRGQLHFKFDRNDPDYLFLRAVAASLTAPPGPEELVVLGERLHAIAHSITSHLSERGISRGATIGADHPGVAALAITTLAHGLDPGTTTPGDATDFVAGLMATSVPLASSSPVAETKELFETLQQGVRVPRNDALLRQERIWRQDVLKWLLRRIGLRRSSWAAEDEQTQMLDVVAIYDAVLNLALSPRVSPLGVRKADAGSGESAAMEALASTVYGKIQTAVECEVKRSRHAITEIAPCIGFDVSNGTVAQLTAGIDEAGVAAESADSLVRDQGMTPPGQLRTNYRQAADLLERVKGGNGIEEAAQLLLHVARTDQQSPVRPIASRLFKNYAAFNGYREASVRLLNRAEMYLGHLIEYIPLHHQTTTEPIMEAFPEEYPRLLASIQDRLELIEAEQSGNGNAS